MLISGSRFPGSLKKLVLQTSWTLHSYRWSAATTVADAGATADQMQDFLGWANAKMNTEYISPYKAAIIKVVQKLQDTETKDNVCHVNVAEKACKECSNLANESVEVAQESQVSDFGELWDDRNHVCRFH